MRDPPTVLPQIRGLCGIPVDSGLEWGGGGSVCVCVCVVAPAFFL